MFDEIVSSALKHHQGTKLVSSPFSHVSQITHSSKRKVKKHIRTKMLFLEVKKTDMDGCVMPVKQTKTKGGCMKCIDNGRGKHSLDQ